MRREFPGVTRPYHRANDLWSGSYVAGSAGGAPIWVPRRYIERQNRPGQGTLGPGGPPARAFTPGLKAGALARNPVARRPGSSR